MEACAPISADALRETVKDLTKKAKFGEACDRLLGWTEVADVVEGDLGKDLLQGVIRCGTVLKTRHAENSTGWRHGLRLFDAAVIAFEGHEDVGKVSELLESAALTVNADDENVTSTPRGEEDRKPESAAPGTRTFEGQFSGEVESEFDRQRRTAGSGTRGGAIPVELFEMFRAPTTTAEARRDALVRWISSEHPEASGEVDVLMDVLSGFDPSSADADDTTRSARSAGSDSLAALAERTVTLRTLENVEALGESECPICREDYAAGDRVIKMPCAHTHVFHRECVARWLRKDDSCPLCRSSLPIWLGRPQYA